ncbi:Transcriptional regulatory protein BaeR [Thermotalea metallivorans]|uniref:Stage 0 sporulation protein A homolog n=1 Tax=Thermotalea metallivorans TaxID=520762 RepID=A0A140KZE4_9FIRM|nr:Transcriptional regulatory protein BaeR [Thermotalea metallivorans]
MLKENNGKILIVDDESKLVEVVGSYLENAGYAVYGAYSGQQALQLIEQVNPSLIILDLMLPDIMGEEVCKMLRKKSKVPIIMLTAKAKEEDILKGLDIGADDYVTKPFSPRQLVARVVALLRRTNDSIVFSPNIISLNNGDLVINSAKHEVKKNGKIVNLTPNEYKILLTMVRYPHKAFTREELIAVALEGNFDGFDRTIDSHIKNLRQKIETNPKTPEYILTVHGVGYKFGGAYSEN